MGASISFDDGGGVGGGIGGWSGNGDDYKFNSIRSYSNRDCYIYYGNNFNPLKVDKLFSTSTAATAAATAATNGYTGCTVIIITKSPFKSKSPIARQYHLLDEFFITIYDPEPRSHFDSQANTVVTKLMADSTPTKGAAAAAAEQSSITFKIGLNCCVDYYGNDDPAPTIIVHENGKIETAMHSHISYNCTTNEFYSTGTFMLMKNKYTLIDGLSSPLPSSSLSYYYYNYYDDDGGDGDGATYFLLGPTKLINIDRIDGASFFYIYPTDNLIEIQRALNAMAAADVSDWEEATHLTVAFIYEPVTDLIIAANLNPREHSVEIKDDTIKHILFVDLKNGLKVNLNHSNTITLVNGPYALLYDYVTGTVRDWSATKTLPGFLINSDEHAAPTTNGGMITMTTTNGGTIFQDMWMPFQIQLMHNS